MLDAEMPVEGLDFSNSSSDEGLDGLDTDEFIPVEAIYVYTYIYMYICAHPCVSRCKEHPWDGTCDPKCSEKQYMYIYIMCVYYAQRISPA